MGKSNYYSGERLEEKVAEKLSRVAMATQGVKSAKDIEAILGSVVFPTASNFCVCTKDTLVYVTTGGMMFKSNKIPISSITGLSMISEQLGKDFICVSVGGQQKITLEIIAAKADATQFFEHLQKLTQNICKNQNPVATNSLSAADEIKKFKELLDQEIITKEEFEQKKKQLLGI